MSSSECLRCGRPLDGDTTVCERCGAAWPVLTITQPPARDRAADRAINLCLAGIVTLIVVFLLLVAW